MNWLYGVVGTISSWYVFIGYSLNSKFNFRYVTYLWVLLDGIFLIKVSKSVTKNSFMHLSQSSNLISQY